MIKIKPPIKTVPNNSMISWHSYNADLGGCWWYRVHLPNLFSNTTPLKKRQIKFICSSGMKYITDKNFYTDKLFVVFQRPATENQLKMYYWFLKQAQSKTKTAIILEIDDDLINVPKFNMAYDFYEKNRKYAIEMIKMSNGVTVSTVPLQNVLKKYNKNIVVNSNHLPKYIWGDIPKIKEINKKPNILWCGSSNHFALPTSNLNGGDFGKKLIDFIIKTTDIYNWHFIGAIPKEIIAVKHKLKLHEWQNISYYPHFIKSLNIDVGIAPLYDHEFNNSKSNLKALEYTAAGIPGIYSKMFPYKNLKNSFTSDEEIINCIEEMCKNDDLRLNTWQHDYDVLKLDLFWEENDNVYKWINNNLSLLNLTLPKGN